MDLKALIPILVIYFALFCDFFLLEGFVIVHPILSENHGWDEKALTQMLYVCKFTMMAACPFVALASTKLASHTILVIGIGFLALSSVILSFSHSTEMFMIGKMAHGIASPSLTLSSMSILTYLAEETTRGQYASYGYAAISHGLLVAPFVTGVMLEHIGQFWTYMTISAILGSTLVLAILHFYDIPLLLNLRRKVVVCDAKQQQVDALANDIQLFEPMTKFQFVTLLKTLLTNPRMLTAVTSCFLVGLSIGSNESVLPVILNGLEKSMGLSDMHVTLIWTAGSIAYMVFATLTGFFADRMAPIKLVFIGMTGFILTFTSMPQVCSSLVGLIAHITMTGALTSFLDVAAYPLIASVVDTANIPNAYIIGYSIEYCLEQAGYAIGQSSGEVLYDITNSLEPLAYMVASADTLLLCFSVFVLFVYPADRFVVRALTADEKVQEKIQMDLAEKSTVSVEEGPVHEQD